MSVYRTRMEPERRSGPDLWVRILGWLGVFGWLLMFVALFIIDKAKPQNEFNFSRAANAKLRSTWNPELTGYLFYLMIFGLCVSIIGSVINARRLHREDDRFRLTMILLGTISVFGIVKYLFF